VTFHAIADYFTNRAIAVLMTGMGNDGASGLKAISLAGGTTIAQDEASSVVFGMPKIAIDTGAAQQVLNIEQIGEQLCRCAQNT
jgi:two-component system chemotaxis response regulator CheB